MPHIIVFEHAGFHGAHKHVFTAEPNLAAGDDNFFNDRISSFVILEGKWEFFLHSNFQIKLGPTLGPGIYPWIEDGGALGPATNDQVSSLRPV